LAAVIRFTTSAFDVTREHPNPINPIYGESLLLWLAQQIKGRIAIARPEPEDWGWYADIDWNGRAYMLGAAAMDEENGAREWVLQIIKHRTLKERLLGREKMRPGDECAEFFRKILEAEPRFTGVSLD
jgi:hypothetical protein